MKKEIYAKKKFGQNFLNDPNIINKIINLTVESQNHIIEIGPGRGALTKKLVKLNKQIDAYEIDSDMVNILNKEIQQSNFNLFTQDFLLANLTSIPKSTIIANIPYYITTDILFKIFDNLEKFDKAILMVQKEVAQRICATYKTKEYSKLSVSCQFLAEVKIEFIVPASCFSPMPKVDSAIISLKFKENMSSNLWKQYKDFFKLCFQNRRKKLLTSLKTVYKENQIFVAFNRLSKDENLRVQELKVSEIIELYHLLNK
ncbi:dimethyladenosine transferase [Mycoplasmopsis mustelae]|uniref:Ribosomal RNA small subunit methyltransferase A n=1 Tax=Mycoplasmopsis mustelae TaxID=171289 RepID=A0A4R7UF01_9BACT|nr:16S rRNA (adenine(1518)-N(6)/adenine(1519)-N(6))-dimethyltransferase RsmA [Mycoplasmopsis mustelae]TDV24473.1 dimethyladenosine transferase [Mycoplasmopsis mustelae]